MLVRRKPRLVCGVSQAIKQSRSHNKQTVTGPSFACYGSQSGRFLVRFKPTPGCGSERRKLVHLGIAYLNSDILKWKHATCSARQLKQTEAGFQLTICTQQGGQSVLSSVFRNCIKEIKMIKKLSKIRSFTSWYGILRIRCFKSEFMGN